MYRGLGYTRQKEEQNRRSWVKKLKTKLNKKRFNVSYACRDYNRGVPEPSQERCRTSEAGAPRCLGGTQEHPPCLGRVLEHSEATVLSLYARGSGGETTMRTTCF